MLCLYVSIPYVMHLVVYIAAIIGWDIAWLDTLMVSFVDL